MDRTLEEKDIAARERALDTSASFVVQAPAGSGKTELLMQRYLALLSLVERPEEVLALTFTRKAAGEMQARVLAALSKAAAGHEPEAPHEAKTIALAKKALDRDALMGWSVLENPGRLKVQTIDSLCASIVRAAPVLSGLSGYSIADDPRQLYREAAEDTVALVEDDGPRGEAVRVALGHMGNSVKALSDRLAVMLEKRDQWRRHIGRTAGPGGLRALLEGSLGRLVDYELKRVAGRFNASFAEALAPLARYAASNVGAQSPISALAGLDGLPACSSPELPLWQGLRALLLTKDGNPRAKVDKGIGFPAGGGEAGERKREFCELLGSISGDAGLVEALSRVSMLPEPRFLDEEWEALEAITGLLPAAEGALAAAFASRGVVDFQEVGLAALRALGDEDEPTDLMLALDVRIQHILVDEYQDTSQAQLALIEALTRGWTEGDGRTVFAVGDPMQSIYLFREAEVGLFLEARLGLIGHVGVVPLVLTRNFRSQASVVDWVNSRLAPAFPSVEDTFSGAVAYSPSCAVRDALSGRGVGITVFGEKDEEAEAREVVSILKATPDGETAAILCRTRASLGAVVEAVKRAGIPFGAQGIDPLAGSLPVRDLMALLRALDHPFDSVAWLACLRAPWCGLALSDLLALRTGDGAGTVREQLFDDELLALLSADGRARAERFRDVMSTALGLWGRQRPSEVLRGLWTGLGGPACLERAEDRADAMRFLGLVEELESAAAVPMDELEARMEGLFADHPGGPGTRLSIMTIHKAKGLEFDNVIIPGMGRRARADDRKLLVWMERGEEDLLLAPIEKRRGETDSGIYAYLSALSREKSANEEARLLYVAATRAKKSLYLLGHAPAGKDGRPKAEAGSLFARMADSLSEGTAVEAAAAEGGRRPSQAAMRRLPARWQLPQAAPSLPSAGAFFAPGEAAPRFYWAGEEVKHLGTAVHKYLCRISKEGVDRWDAKRIKGEAERISSMLRSLGLGAAAARRAAAEGVRILARSVEDDRGRWALRGRDEAESELPLTAVVGGEVVRVVIDRTFVEDGTRWVVDFKTGFHEGGSLDEFLERERERYEGQLARYEAALRARGETRPIRKGLYYPAHGAWVEL